MTRVEADKVLKLLERIKEPDAAVKECILILQKQFAMWDKAMDDRRRHYELESFDF